MRINSELSKGLKYLAATLGASACLIGAAVAAPVHGEGSSHDPIIEVYPKYTPPKHGPGSSHNPIIATKKRTLPPCRPSGPFENCRPSSPR